MGVVLLEAMASGTPVVASNISGYATVVTSGVDGWLITPRQSQELAHFVGQLLENEPLRQKFIQSGLRKVQRYSWPQIADLVLAYYTQLSNPFNAGSTLAPFAG